jgi:hypothetical protein
MAGHFSCGHFALFIRCNSAQGEMGFPALHATDQLFALGNVSNCNEIPEIAPYEISGDHHEQMRTVAEGNFVLAASEGTFGGKPTAFFDLFRVDNGKVAEHWDVMADIPATMAHGNESSEPYVITALAQRWSGLFSHSAANAVVQLKS